MRKIFFYMMLVSSQAGFALNNPIVPTTYTPVDQHIGRQILSFLLVIGMILVCAWILKKTRHLTSPQHKNIKVITATPLGIREKLVLIQVGEQQILLGVTPQSINTLYVLQEPLTEHNEKQKMPFSHFLKPFLATPEANPVKDDKNEKP
jgi:flagellar protein FliO/FliZ